MTNRLKNETSPYLIQHAENPVDWFPWCEEAFLRAKKEDKPVFLSIGYSTCHWCHVMAHESFEDEKTAELLNKYFISIKVDKEERPDIDSIYMAFCQAFTGSGGWPTSIFMTPDQKPFFAGTYFPPVRKGGMIGFRELLALIHNKWIAERRTLIDQAEYIIFMLKKREQERASTTDDLPNKAIRAFKGSYDRINGGFGRAPKFPSPHNLMFLMLYYEKFGDKECLEMTEHTLIQMYRGGLFDHIGYGFCRYSTDVKFLVPHFEKMLYDNALLMLAYCKAYTITQKKIYLNIAEKTAAYILREMTAPDGGFYSAQDADSDGEEGKYYTFTPNEIIKILGEKTGTAFNWHFDISEVGNFDGKSIPNLLSSDYMECAFNDVLECVAEYRKTRCQIHTDDKILASWNSLMIAAMCSLYRISKNEDYLSAAKRADDFIKEKMYKDDVLHVSYRKGRQGVKGFLSDYAAYVFANISLFEVTQEEGYLNCADTLCKKVISEFKDRTCGGLYLYSENNEKLIIRPKDSGDGAIPGGNSLMAWNLVRMSYLKSDPWYVNESDRQLEYMAREASKYPTGYSMFLSAYLEREFPPVKVIAVLGKEENAKEITMDMGSDTVWVVLDRPTSEFPLKNEATTYYVCKGSGCMPPVNDLTELD